jgi:hypothetical protein
MSPGPKPKIYPSSLDEFDGAADYLFERDRREAEAREAAPREAAVRRSLRLRLHTRPLPLPHGRWQLRQPQSRRAYRG